ALAFPLHPPGRPEQSRADELRAAGTQVLVVNGERDPFGIPAARDASRVVVLPGETHSLSRRPAAVGEAVGGCLDDLAGLPVRRYPALNSPGWPRVGLPGCHAAGGCWR